jgi:hypothetical protein
VNPIRLLAGCFLTIATLRSTRPKPPAGRPAPLTSAIRALETESWLAWKSHDAAFFERFLADDHVEVHSYGIVGKSAVVEGVRSSACVVQNYAGPDHRDAGDGRRRPGHIPRRAEHGLWRREGSESGLGNVALCEARRQVGQRSVPAHARCTKLKVDVLAHHDRFARRAIRLALLNLVRAHSYDHSTSSTR